MRLRDKGIAKSSPLLVDLDEVAQKHNRFKLRPDWRDQLVTLHSQLLEIAAIHFFLDYLL